MRSLFFGLFFVSITFTYSQNKFVFNQNGLTPKYTISNIDGLTENEIHRKTLKWVETKYKEIDAKNENNFILLMGIKNNKVNVGKLYYHIKYTIKISFEKGKYRFEPLRIESKLNSKYDFGWTDFDFKNGTSYFKRGKVIKKTKSFVINIPDILNELNTNLYHYLVMEKTP